MIGLEIRIWMLALLMVLMVASLYFRDGVQAKINENLEYKIRILTETIANLREFRK